MAEKVFLCSACAGCPYVEIEGNEVWIGEEGNQARLTREQWNCLVEKIKAGELKTL